MTDEQRERVEKILTPGIPLEVDEIGPITGRIIRDLMAAVEEARRCAAVYLAGAVLSFDTTAEGNSYQEQQRSQYPWLRK